MSFDNWLDARDSAAIEREWATLGATRVEVGQEGPPYLAIQTHGAALLAAGFLGCSPDRFAWWTTERYADPSAWPEPTFRQGLTVSRSFLDGSFAVDEPDCSEALYIREVTEGARGVQHITIECAWGEMTREGGNGRSTTVVRVFDRRTQRAVSIPLHSREVWTLGEIDLSPLDLFAHRVELKLGWKAYTPDALRGFLAQLTADLDAHFDTSTTWPGGVTVDEVIDNKEYKYRVRRRVYRYEQGPFAIDFNELLDPDKQAETGWLVAHVYGLPWGHEVSARIDSATDASPTVTGWVDLRLPRAQLDATLARLAAVPTISLG